MAASNPRHALIFASSTNIGKTICSTGLLLAASRAFGGVEHVHYIKPVQTGGASVDETFVRDYLPSSLTAHTLYSYSQALSPHVAVSKDRLVPPTGRHIRQAVSAVLQPQRFTAIETAGGPLSPCPDGTLQADVFRLSRLQAVLVGDGRLGGISSTLTALESLLSRDYHVASIVLFCSEADDVTLGNASFLKGQLAVPVRRLGGIPREGPLRDFFASNSQGFDSVLHDVVHGHPERGEIEK